MGRQGRFADGNIARDSELLFPAQKSSFKGFAQAPSTPKTLTSSEFEEINKVIRSTESGRKLLSYEDALGALEKKSVDQDESDSKDKKNGFDYGSVVY